MTSGSKGGDRSARGRSCRAARRSASCPSVASTQTQRIAGSTSQVPSARTPPHGPLRICLAQLVGQAMPVEDSTHWPHILQSTSNCFVARSSGRSNAFHAMRAEPPQGTAQMQREPRAGVIDPLEARCVPHAPMPQRLHAVVPGPLVDMSTRIWHLAGSLDLISVKLSVFRLMGVGRAGIRPPAPLD